MRHRANCYNYHHSKCKAILYQGQRNVPTVVRQAAESNPNLAHKLCRTGEASAEVDAVKSKGKRAAPEARDKKENVQVNLDGRVFYLRPQTQSGPNNFPKIGVCTQFWRILGGELIAVRYAYHTEKKKKKQLRHTHVGMKLAARSARISICMHTQGKRGRWM